VSTRSVVTGSTSACMSPAPYLAHLTGGSSRRVKPAEGRTERALTVTDLR
jgi:hypothetical protein